MADSAASWRWRRDLERCQQLRLDLADSLGRLVTMVAAVATSEPAYNSEVAKWDQIRSAALRLVDGIVDQTVRGELAPAPADRQRTIQIGSVGGDVILALVDSSQAVSVGKEIKQDENQTQ
jgi:hypothetical protein